jgi:hypothetical protein
MDQKLIGIFFSLIFALAPVMQNPTGPTAAIISKVPAGGGGSVSIDNHTYYPNSGLSACTANTTCVITTGSNFVISTTGDTVKVYLWSCFANACASANTGTITLSDGGTNTYTQTTAETYVGTTGGTQGIVVFTAVNATAGTYTLTASTTDSVNGFNYVFAEAVALKNAHTSGSIDTSVSNTHFATTTTAASITSAGNVSASGEVAIAAAHCGGSVVSNSGSYTTLDLNTSDGAMVVYFLGPSSGSTTTAGLTCGASSTAVTSIGAIKP